MDFKYKTLEELQAMSSEEQLKYLEEKATHEADLRKKEIKDAIEAFKTENAEAHKADIEGLETKLTDVTKALEHQIASYEALKETASQVTVGPSIEKQVADFFAENKEKIEAIKIAGTGMVSFQIKDPDAVQMKVVGDMTTTSASNPDGIPELVGTQVAPATRVNLRGTFINSLITMFNTGLAAFPYTESVPKDGDSAYTAEGALKSQIDFKIETRYASPLKPTAFTILTDESIQDIAGLQSIATDYLRSKHDLRRQKGILFGDGVAPNPEGATVVARVFSAGPLALSIPVPNFMDIVNACITDIYTTQNFPDEVPYMANLVMINPNDFFIEFQSAKDNDGLPLFPQASLFNQVSIGGVTIIPEIDIPVGQIFVSDLTKYNVSNYIPYTVRIGFINDQFITNKFTMVGESRHHAYVKELDKQAFIFDAIATIRVAITKP